MIDSLLTCNGLASEPQNIEQGILSSFATWRLCVRCFSGPPRAVSGQRSASLVHRTEGTSGVFIREFMHRTALEAVTSDSNLEVKNRHLNDAFRELIVDGGEFTRSFLGFQPPSRREE